MSVKIRLNNKNFLAGNSMVIGGRLFEGEAPAQQTQQPAANNANQNQAAPAQNAQTAPAQNTQTAPAQQTANQNQNTQTQQTQQPQNSSTGQTIDQQVQGVLVKHFGGMQQAIAADLKAIQGPQWVNVIAPKDQSLNSVMAALQEYVKQNVEVAKKFVAGNQQQNASTGQNNQNASTGQNTSTGA